MEIIWIIGAGKFGKLALKRLSERRKGTRFVLVDPAKENLNVDQPNCAVETADGVEYVWAELGKGNEPEWIIPALPVHLAAEWALKTLGPEVLERVPIPPEVDSQLRHPLRGGNGDIYVTHADFLCPDDCAEPSENCTVTQRPRGRNMFQLLAETSVPPFRPLVIRSRQLGPGIGGYRPGDLFDLLERIRAVHGNILLCTACRCHGVITGLERH